MPEQTSCCRFIGKSGVLCELPLTTTLEDAAVRDFPKVDVWCVMVQGPYHISRVVATAALLPSPSVVLWKFKSTFWLGYYTWSFVIWFWGCGERSLETETGVLHRIPIQIL